MPYLQGRFPCDVWHKKVHSNILAVHVMVHHISDGLRHPVGVQIRVVLCVWVCVHACVCRWLGVDVRRMGMVCVWYVCCGCMLCVCGTCVVCVVCVLCVRGMRMRVSMCWWWHDHMTNCNKWPSHSSVVLCPAGKIPLVTLGSILCKTYLMQEYTR